MIKTYNILCFYHTSSSWRFVYAAWNIAFLAKPAVIICQYTKNSTNAGT